MDSSHGKLRMNEESDRLSSLPDDLIHKILSFIDIKEAIGTGVLSPRWRFIWTSLPYLDFSSLDLSIKGFYKLPKFSKFVTNVLSRRNNLSEVYSMKVRIRVKKSLLFVKRILKYAFSHNIQHLDVVFELEDASDSLLSLFSSQPLKHLGLTMEFEPGHRYCFNSCFASTPGLPTLTTLDLSYVNPDNVDKCIIFISKCANLKDLTLKDFNRLALLRSNGLSIFHPQLSNLTLERIDFGGVVNIDASQLKNLTIMYCDAKFVISAPVLASLLYKGYSPLALSTDGFHILEKADICFPCRQDADIHRIVCQLQLLHNVKFLTLNIGIVELLSSSKDLILQQPSPFVNLKSLKIFPETICPFVKSKKAPKKVTTMSTKVKSYLLGGSPRSTLTMVLSEEVLAQKLMDEIRVCLEKENDIFDTCRAHLERGKTPEESHGPKKLESGGNMVQIQSGWKDLVEQFQRREENSCLVISKLESIQELLTKLPESNRAKIQPCLSSLCAEARTAISRRW
ncbi:hypothetical protein SSX86_029460 [Deinandra increscens subsp. villosa]|uniref:F-box domain-containing protein n=1 Tax=Deinandra increscens subsp. villosa TaxID=3103831 RepID=A0AAP0GMD4_9ASTR